MIRSLTQQVVRVAMLATLMVAAAEAQSGGGSDFTGPGGGGGGAGGLSISNPAGGTVTVAPATARAVAAVLSGGGAPAAQNLQNVLVGEGVPAGPAGTLANAMAALGANPSRANLVAAIEAFNAAIDAGAGTPSPAMLAVRFALASASR